MKKLTNIDILTLKGGFWKPFITGLTGAVGFFLGEDLSDVWNEGWNDPYGKD